MQCFSFCNSDRILQKSSKSFVGKIENLLYHRTSYSRAQHSMTTSSPNQNFKILLLLKRGARAEYKTYNNTTTLTLRKPTGPTVPQAPARVHHVFRSYIYSTCSLITNDAYNQIFINYDTPIKLTLNRSDFSSFMGSNFG